MKARYLFFLLLSGCYSYFTYETEEMRYSIPQTGWSTPGFTMVLYGEGCVCFDIPEDVELDTVEIYGWIENPTSTDMDLEIRIPETTVLDCGESEVYLEGTEPSYISSAPVLFSGEIKAGEKIDFHYSSLEYPVLLTSINQEKMSIVVKNVAETFSLQEKDSLVVSFHVRVHGKTGLFSTLTNLLY
ncbi:hypothetical protein DRQ16_02300 [bacterium]|nr:MAG: hypothetical protein DRQ16_02300 [bacterium]RKZ25804.1 MAG: hypothetical protein DRQ20_04365 [bacterium]